LIPACAAAHAACTCPSSPPSPPPEIAACVTPAADRSLAMPVHAARTAFSMFCCTVVSDVTAVANAFASAEPLQLEFAMLLRLFAALHPSAKMGIATSEARTAAVFQALILIMTSTPSRWEARVCGAPSSVGRKEAVMLHGPVEATRRAEPTRSPRARRSVFFQPHRRCRPAVTLARSRENAPGQPREAAMAARIDSIPFAIRSSLVA
jgi:hypothetical protein